MRKRVFAIIAVFLMISLFTLSAFAADSEYEQRLKATKVPVWPDGIGNPVGVGADYNEFGGIVSGLSNHFDSNLTEFVNYQLTTYGVYYTLKFEFDASDRSDYILIPYATTFSKVIVSTVVINNSIYTSDLTKSDLTIENSLGHFDGDSRYRFVYTIFTDTLYSYSYTPASSRTYVRFDISSLRAGTVYIQFNVSFSDSDITGIMDTDYGTMWIVLSDIVDDDGIPAVGEIVSEIISFTWIYKLVLCSLILVVAGLLANFLTSL